MFEIIIINGGVYIFGIIKVVIFGIFKYFVEMGCDLK